MLAQGTPEENGLQADDVLDLVDSMTREHGTSDRTFKSALIWSIAESDSQLDDEARKVLAWEDIRDEEGKLQLDDSQKRQLKDNLRKSERDLKEAVWRAYRYVALLGREKIEIIDLGLVHSSAASSMPDLILSKLKRDDLAVESISPKFLVRNWPAFKEWSTKAVRDAFFASPKLPRLSNPDSIKETIARGVSGGVLGYVGKVGEKYEPFLYKEGISVGDVEISEDMFIITSETAEEYIKIHTEPPELAVIEISPRNLQLKPGETRTFVARGLDQHERDYPLDRVVWTATGGAIGEDGHFQAGEDEGSFTITAAVGDIIGSAAIIIEKWAAPTPAPGPETLLWTGEIPPQKWMNVYTKVLSGFARNGGLKLTLNVEITSEEGISEQRIEEMKAALRELGLNDDVNVSKRADV